MNKLYSKQDMIAVVKDYLGKKGFQLAPDYARAFEPARVPVFGFKKKGQGIEEVFVDIITEQVIETKGYFRDRVFERVVRGPGWEIPGANSSQFFRHYFPQARIFWAIPDYIVKKDEFYLFLSNCQKQNIGLLEVRAKDSSVKEILDSVPLINQRLQELKKAVESSNRDRRSFQKLIEKWSQKDLSYLVFYPEPKYLATDISIRDKKYSISRELINKMSLLKYVSYRDILIDFSQTYHAKSKDDYSIALDITQSLWARYKIEFPKLHADFEFILKRDPKYRDHFLHAFQVFLFGVYIIDILYPEKLWCSLFSKRQGNRIEDSWLFAATYHDYNYMIQKFDDWTQDFFKSALHIDTMDNPAQLHLGEPYVNHGYMLKTKIFTESIFKEVDDVVLSFLYDRILRKKNHGLLSGLSLLKYLENNACKTLSHNGRSTACRAICLHDMDIWLHMAGIAQHIKEDKDRTGEAFNAKKFLSKLSLKSDPISFLLILSDSLQEQGREKDVDESRAELESVYKKRGQLYIEISYDGDNAKKVFEEKIGELTKVFSFLDGSKRFDIKVKNLTDSQSHDFTV
jgi:hypothetical protein